MAQVETLQQQLGALRRDFDKAQEKAEKEKAQRRGRSGWDGGESLVEGRYCRTGEQILGITSWGIT